MIRQSNGHGSVECESTLKNGKVREERLLFKRQRLETPGDRVAHRSMAAVGIMRRPLEKGEDAHEIMKDAVGWDFCHTRRGKLDCQRQSIESAADRCDIWSIPIG